MNAPRKQIPPERKAMYYGGMALIAIGILLFVSTFFTGPDIGGRNDPQPQQLGRAFGSRRVSYNPPRHSGVGFHRDF
jgi:hypothetical protein